MSKKSNPSRYLSREDVKRYEPIRTIARAGIARQLTDSGMTVSANYIYNILHGLSPCDSERAKAVIAAADKYLKGI